MHAAAIYSAEKLIDRLLEHNSNLVNFVDANGQTPLHYALKNIFNYKGVSASAYSMKDITRFNPGNKYNSNQKEEYEKEGAVNKLIKIEPKLADIDDKEGQTALHWAAFLGKEIIQATYIQSQISYAY